ncbi:hypothetical protein BVC80_1821g19 [Macleaya cordata]|uniref:GIR1-like zinc ribbon domain-containing protein n=1 Tax=Macleaya cordata TaxID=56857 RepID=A0A200QZE9_MACCD|nr:hypothetical protein BVC80_1821g19 [Macleaya cordata]
MAADVSSLVRILNGYNDEQQLKQQVMKSTHEGKSKVLITRDLLGGSSSTSTKLGSKELDLDLQVPNGWEKRLDMKSGKIYLQKCNIKSPKSSSSSSSEDQNHNDQQKKQSIMIPELQDLNFPPSPTKSKNLSLTEQDQSLDLKLVVNVPYYKMQMMTTTSSSSVCTLDKVKSALERAEKESSSSSSAHLLGLNNKKKRSSMSYSTDNINNNGVVGGGASISSSSCTTYSSPSSASNLMIKKEDQGQDQDQDQDEAEDSKKKYLSSSSSTGGLLFAGGCPGCLSYVLISKINPKCPRCESIIPSPSTPKKPRIDLNISI